MQQKWWTLISVCIGTFMLLLDVTIVIVALPQIQLGLHSSFSDVQWVVDAYALTLASLLMTAGVLADRYGRRLLFSIGLVIFTIGSLLCGVAQTPLMLIVSRSGQGIGGAIMFSTSLALLGHSFRGRDRGLAFGIWGAITGVAVSLGPILGGVLTTGISWRSIFLVNVPVGVVALAITVARVEESRSATPGHPDWLGFVLLTSGLVGIVYGLIRASETRWSDHFVVASLVIGCALLAGFIVCERLVADPMFDVSLFRTPTFVGGLIAAFAMNGSLFAVLLYIVLYLQDLLGYSALDTGVRLLVSSGAVLISATVAGRLSERVPVRLLIGPGLGLVGLGLWLMSGLNGSSTWTHLIPGLIVSGLGAGCVNPPLASTAIGVVSPERAGMASGVNATMRQVGLATSIAALGSIFASSLSRYLHSTLGLTPAIARHAGQVAGYIRRGETNFSLPGLSPSDHSLIESAVRTSFASSINDLLIATGSLAFFGAIAAFVLIRENDFVRRERPAGEEVSLPGDNPK